MELTIKGAYTKTWDDGNSTVTLDTQEKGPVLFKVKSGEENPFANYKDVNGRVIVCEISEFKGKNYISRGNFDWKLQPPVNGYQNGAAVPSTPPPTPVPVNNGIPTHITGDSRQNSIERQACMKTAQDCFDCCLSNGVVNAQGWTTDQITDWIADVSSKLRNKCLG